MKRVQEEMKVSTEEKESRGHQMSIRIHIRDEWLFVLNPVVATIGIYDVKEIVSLPSRALEPQYVRVAGRTCDAAFDRQVVPVPCTCARTVSTIYRNLLCPAVHGNVGSGATKVDVRNNSARSRSTKGAGITLVDDHAKSSDSFRSVSRVCDVANDTPSC